MSSSQSVAVSVPTPVSATTTLQSTSSALPPSSSSSSETVGTTRGGMSTSESSQTPSQQQQQQHEQCIKAQQAAALKQVKLTTMKHPPGIDPLAVMKEREARLESLPALHVLMCVLVCVWDLVLLLAMCINSEKAIKRTLANSFMYMYACTCTFSTKYNCISVVPRLSSARANIIASDDL